MTDTPDGPHLSAIARLNQWSKLFPNARLAAVGLLLLLLTVGAMFAVAALDHPVFDGNVNRETPLQKDPIWRRLAPLIAVFLEFALLGEMATIVLAGYRSIRSPVVLGWAILLSGSALAVVLLSVFYPPGRDQGSGVRARLEPPYAPRIRKMPPILTITAADADRIATSEVKKREGWADKDPHSVAREGNEWRIWIGNPAEASEYRVVTLDGNSGKLVTYEKIGSRRP